MFHKNNPQKKRSSNYDFDFAQLFLKFRDRIEMWLKSVPNEYLHDIAGGYMSAAWSLPAVKTGLVRKSRYEEGLEYAWRKSRPNKHGQHGEWIRLAVVQHENKRKGGYKYTISD